MSIVASPVKYHSPEELENLSAEELAALWDLIPTDRQRLYKEMYAGHLRSEGVSASVGSDALEKQVLLSLIQQYQEDGLVPAGAVWTQPPLYIREAAMQNEAPVDAQPDKADKKQVNPKLLIVGAVALLLVGFLLMRGRGSKSSTVAGAGTKTATATATALKSPTPTPLALENQDSVIQSGDAAKSANTLAYPVLLKVDVPGIELPRIFVVQRRAVKTAEWDFDTNPDTASFITGMAVRPTIGIPWSEENTLFFRSLTAGAKFEVRMNTGAVLHYEFISTQNILRSDTSILRQIGPGLVLILIGERDEEGALTASRPVVTAAYVPDQELSREGVLMNVVAETAPTNTPTAVPTPVDRVSVEIVSVQSDRPNKRLTAALRIFNSRRSGLTITADSLWLAVGYAEHPAGPRVPAEGLQTFDLLPGQAVYLTVTFPWGGEPWATLGTALGVSGEGSYEYGVQLAS